MTTRNTNILCPNPKCGQPYTPGTEFCGNCGMRLTSVDRPTFPVQGNTPIPPPPPYPSLASSPLKPEQPVVPTQPFWTRGKIIVLSVLLFLIIGIFGYQIGRNSNPAQPPATTTPGTTPTTASGTTPTATAQATVKPSTTSIKKQLPCSKCSNGEPILLTINKISVSSTEMIWDTTFTNQSGNNASYNVTTFYLQDPSRRQHIDGTGAILTSHGSGNWLTPGQFDNGEIIFSFVPYAGVAYTLTAEVDDTYYPPAFMLPFDPITLTCTDSSCQFS